MTLNIHAAGNSDKDIWDKYVQGHPLASPCHLFAWGEAVESAYGHKAYYLMAEECGKVTGVMPMIYMKAPLFSGRLVSLPFCDSGDVLADDERTRENLLLESALLARDLKVGYIELRGELDKLSFSCLDLPVNALSHKVKLKLELPGSSDILWDEFRSKLRSQIRKAEKNGLVFRWGSIDDIEKYYAAFSLNMRDLGSPVHSREWFRSILMYYGERARMGMVYYGDELVGAGITLGLNGNISLPWASTVRDYNRLSPNMLLYWNLLKYASDNGYGVFDFGRSTPDEGTYNFKVQWGAKPVPLHWNYIIFNNRQLKSGSSGSPAREIIARLWQTLPLRIANYMGPAIRKHISL